MKTLRLIVLTAVCLVGSYAFAQDLIVKRDGTVIKAKVAKVGTSEVEYKKWSNQDGPQYSIAVADVLAINYKNGEKETFENVAVNEDRNSKASNTKDVTSKEETPVESPENKGLIDLYNNQVLQLAKSKFTDGKARYVYPIYGITSNSVLSDSHVTVYFSKIYDDSGEIDKNSWLLGYAIRVQNKSDENIYIDLANSFKIDDKGNSKPYYTNKTYTTNASSSSGGGLNVGAVTGSLGIGGTIGTLANGVNVGGGKTNGTTVTETEERILIVPPHAAATLPLEKQAENKSIVEVPEMFLPHTRPSGLDLKLHEYKDICTEQNTNSLYRRVITYSTSPDFVTYKRLKIGIFLKGALGAYYSIFANMNANPYKLKATNWDYLILGEIADSK